MLNAAPIKRFLFPAILLLALLAIPRQSRACDVCSCTAGLQTRINKNYFGLNLRYRYFFGTSGHSHGLPGTEASAQAIHQHFSVAELNLRWYPWKWLQVRAWLPAGLNYAQEGNANYTYGGLGDAQLIASFRLFDLDKGDAGRNQLFLGAGLKLPTGSANEVKPGLLWEPHYQTGTGSWDIPLTASWYFRKPKWGLSAESFYRINTQNQRNFHFGNVFQAAANIFWELGGNNTRLFPSLGLRLNQNQADRWFEMKMENTGGIYLNSSAGLDLWWNDLNLGITASIPVWQHWQGAQPFLQVQSSLRLGVQW